MDFLPVNKNDLKRRGWDELDIILVSGDAYVDHPSWAAAILGRFLELNGYRVGIIAQPDWQNLNDFKELGSPRLFFGVSAGNLDTMVNHYTADKKKRQEDLYSPGGKSGYRPDRATIVYTNRLREAYPGVPIIIGGVEASLRRLAHYDYWADKVRRSILMDSKADMLLYGMGEYSLLEVARYLNAGKDIKYMHRLRGSCYVSSVMPKDAVELPSYEDVSENTTEFSKSTRLIHLNTNPISAPILAQKHGDRWVIANPPAVPLTSQQIDDIYEAPFLRRYHPMYEAAGGVPALKPVQFSMVTHRGCFGGCSFCSIGLHQGKYIQSRSIKSLQNEAKTFLSHPDFKGSIPDVGGPSANMYGLTAKDTNKCQQCSRESCLYPQVCKNLNTDQSPSVRLWRKLREIQGIRHIRVASGVRYDLVLKDKSNQYLRELCKYHVGGQLKVAPEHVSAQVTKIMGKPGSNTYKHFIERFNKINLELQKDQYLIPYFISAHPGSGLKETVELAEFVRNHMQYYPEQVQNFTPTPMTISTSMYHTGINPLTNSEVYVPSSTWERKAQRALLQYRNPDNHKLVLEALEAGDRTDLIGSSPSALVRRKKYSDSGKPEYSKKKKTPTRRTRRSTGNKRK